MSTPGKSLLLILVGIFSFMNTSFAQKIAKQPPPVADTLNLQSMLTFTPDERDKMVDEIYWGLGLSEKFNPEEAYKILNLDDFIGKLDMNELYKDIDWNVALKDVDWNSMMAGFDWNEMKLYMCDSTTMKQVNGAKMDSSLYKKGTDADPMKCLGNSKSMSFMQMMDAIDQNCLLELIVKRKINFQLNPKEADMKSFCAMAECMDFNPMFKNMDWNCYFQQIDMNMIFKKMNFNDFKNGLKDISTQDTLLEGVKNKNPLLKNIDVNKLRAQIKIDSNAINFNPDQLSVVYKQLFDKIVGKGWLESLQWEDPAYFSKMTKMSLSMLRSVFGDTKAFKYHAVFTWLTYEANTDIKNLNFKETVKKQFLQKDILIIVRQEKLFDQLTSKYGSLRANIGKDFEEITISSVYQNLGTTYNLMGQYSEGLKKLEEAARIRALITSKLPSLQSIDQILQPSCSKSSLESLKQQHGISPNLFSQLQLNFIYRKHPDTIQRLIDNNKYEEAIGLYLVFKDIVLSKSSGDSISPSYVIQNKMTEKTYGLKMIKGIYENIVAIMDVAGMQKDLRYSLYQEAPSVLERFEQDQWQAVLYLQIGQTYYAMNNYEFALKYLEQSRMLLESLKNLDYIQVMQPGISELSQTYLSQSKAPVYVGVYNTLANIYVRRKQYEKAKQLLLNSKAWIKSRIDKEDKLSKEEFKNTLFNIDGSLGEIYLIQGRPDPDSAMLHFQTTKSIAQKSNNVLLNFYSCSYLGNYYQQKNNLDSARIYFSEARATAEKLNFKYGMANTSMHLGYVLKQQGQASKAVELYNYGENVARSISYYPVLYQIHALRAKMHEEKGDYQSALMAYDQGIRIVEDSIFSFFQGEGSRQLTLESTFDCYAGAVACALQLGQKEKAFVYVQMSKNRTLNELLAEGALRAKDIPEDLRRKRDDLLYKLHEIRFQYIINKNETELKSHQDSLLAQLGILNAEIQNIAGKRSNNFGMPSDMTVHTVQKLLTPAQALIDYFVGRDIYAFVIMRDSFKLVNLGPSQEKLLLVNDFKEILDSIRVLGVSNDDLVDMVDLLPSLYDTLFAPIQQSGALKGVKELIIMPDHELFRIPFESLIKKPQHYLADDYAIIRYYPSSVTFYQDKQSKKPKAEFSSDLLLVAKSNFKEYNREEDSLKMPDLKFFTGIFKKGVAHLFEEKATAKALAEMDLRKYRYIYFSTHGIIENVPELSYLALTGGPLSLYQTFDLKLNSDVVVMDACETAGGQFQRGAGVMGFTRGFMYAGARSLLISQWPVREDPSAELSKAFFMYLAKDGAEKCSAAEALAKAKKHLRTMKDGKYKHPYYWSAFVFYGQE